MKEQKASSATSPNGPGADREREIRRTSTAVSVVIDAANRGLGTRGDGRQWRVGDKDKDFRRGGRSAPGASPRGTRIHAGSRRW